MMKVFLKITTCRQVPLKVINKIVESKVEK